MMQVIGLCCGRFGWERAMVMGARDIDDLDEWRDERSRALSAGQDYRTILMVMPRGEGG